MCTEKTKLEQINGSVSAEKMNQVEQSKSIFEFTKFLEWLETGYNNDDNNLITFE